jgi:dihydrofolate reductase
VARLIYSAIASLDGYVADAAGNFGELAPDEEVFAFVNDLERSIGTYLYGRRMYEVLSVWEHAEDFADQRSVMRDFADIWQAADKIVYSTTLATVTTTRTRIERRFEPEAIRQIKAQATQDITVGGADLARQAAAAGLVDEWQLFVVPVVLGGGTRALAAKVRQTLELVDHRRFASGVVYLDYRALASG